MSIQKTRTTPEHPQINGLVERPDITIEIILSKVVLRNQRDCDLLLPLVISTYRSSSHERTG